MHKYKIFLAAGAIFVIGLSIFLNIRNSTLKTPDPTVNQETDKQISQQEVLGTQIYISGGEQGYSAGGMVALSSLDEPYVEIRGYQVSGEIEVEVYKANEDALISYLEHDKDKMQTATTPDISKFTYIATTKQNLGAGYQGTRFNLPLDGIGIWYLKVKGGLADTHAFVVRSDIGALVKEGNNEFIIWAQSFKTRRSISDASVKVYNLENGKNELGNSGFNQDGVAVAPLEVNADIAIVTKGDDKAIVPLNLQYLNTGYSYNSYQPKTSQTKFFVFTDRPLYRPGDKIYFKSILRDDDDAKYSVPTGTARVRIYTDWQEESIVFDRNYPISPSGSIDGDWVMPADAKIGYYRMTVQSPGGAISYAYFQGAFFRKPEYSIDVTIDKTDYVSGDTAKFKISGSYFSGQPLNGQNVKYTVYSGDFYEYSYLSERQYELTQDYRYGWYGSKRVKEGIVTLDQKGEVEVAIDTKLGDQIKKSQVYSIEAEFDNGSGNPSFARKNILVYSGEYGIYQKEYNKHSVKTGEQFSLPVVLVSRRGKSVNGKKLAVKIHRTHWVREQKQGEKYPNYRKEEEDLPDQSLTVDSQGNTTFKFTPSKVGSYELTLEGKDDLGNTISKSFWAYVHQDDEPFYWENQQASGLTVNADKQLYNPDDTAELTIYSQTPDSDVFLSLERGNSHRYQVVKLSGKKATASVKLGNEDMPNIYAAVASFNDKALDTNTINIKVSTESKKLTVNLTADRKTYGPGDQVNLNLETKDNQGNPVSSEVAVWSVDKALFELIDNNLGDIFDTFWQERYNSTQFTHSLQGIVVNTAEQGGCFAKGTQVSMSDGSTKSIEDIKPGDVILSRSDDAKEGTAAAKVLKVHKTKDIGYFIINSNLRVTPNHKMWINGSWNLASTIQTGDRLLGSNVQDIKVESIEWLRGNFEVYNLSVEKYQTFFADGVWVHNQKGDGGRQIFKDTAYWNPSVRTDVNGRAQLSFKLPDNLTTWVLSAVGATETTVVGQTASEVVVTKDVIVRPILPNILREGDEVRLSALVQNFTEMDQIFDVDLAFDSGQVKEATHSAVIIKSKETKQLYWETLPVNENEKAKLIFSARSKDNNKLSDTIVSQLPVRLFGFSGQTGQTGEGEKIFAVDLEEDVNTSKSSVSVSVAPTIIGTLPAAMKYLVDYPYGCVEQTTSRFVPAVIAKANVVLLEEALEGKDVDDMIAKGLSRLNSLQMSDGGWGWWSGGGSSPFITSYVLEYVLYAQQLGANVDSSMLAQAKSYAERERQNETKEEKVARYYALSLFSGADKNRLIADLNNLSPDILAMAVIANFKNGDTNPASNGLTKLLSLAQPQGDALFWGEGSKNFFASRDGSTGLAIRAIVETGGDRNFAAKGARYLLRSRKSHYWTNSFSTAQVIRSVVELSKTGDEQSPNYTYTVSIDGQNIATGTVNSAKQIIKPIVIPINSIKPGGSQVAIAKNGEGQIYSTLLTDQYHTSKDTKARQNGLTVSREYVNTKGEEYNIAVGDIVDVKITLDGLGSDEYYGVIEDELPSGLIPINESFKNQQFNSQPGNYYSNFGVSDREYTENGVVLSMYRIHSGKQTHSYRALAVSGGTFSATPAKASLMYAPEIYGRSDASKLTIADQSAVDPAKLAKKKLGGIAGGGKPIVAVLLVILGSMVFVFIFLRKRNISFVGLKNKILTKLSRKKDTIPPNETPTL